MKPFQAVYNLEQERLKRFECPTCHSKMVEVGCLTINIKGKEEKNGNYCANCYSEWIAATFPKFIDPV